MSPTSDFKPKATTRDADLGAALAAATAIIAATSSGSEATAIAGVIVAGLIVAVAVGGRYFLRKGTADATATVVATVEAAEKMQGLGEDVHPDAERDEELLAIGQRVKEELTGNEAPASLEAIEEWDPEDGAE